MSQHFMFGTQFITVAARVERWSWRPSQRFGGGQFGIMVRLANDAIEIGGVPTPLERQTFWLNVAVTEKQVNKPQFNSVLQNLRTGEQTGNSFFIATGCRIKTSGSGRQSLRCGLSGFRTRDTLNSFINRVILDVNCVELADRWMCVGETYRVPNPQQGQSNFGERRVWVYLPQPMQIYQGHPVYVEGRLAAKDAAGNQNLYVIAELVA
jgi:hypothetical protein